MRIYNFELTIAANVVIRYTMRLLIISIARRGTRPEKLTRS